MTDIIKSITFAKVNKKGFRRSPLCVGILFLLCRFLSDTRKGLIL
ncbi:hypothetical protein BACCOPRO_00356 [Phocaeicola coprophilus DSM 18228 = JCM 13818]|uniref:Uncharacterized protein n=1 Tax=Phocaeicola coprophilus DSM 18228 = JCM 13818 TaxID=547042 RepID=S0F493_9BACT|nr:hypothetical protein BACCOPRO_00356 [Phocaeicola coprophilus DSM 18228 = JCM 13818]